MNYTPDELERFPGVPAYFKRWTLDPFGNHERLIVYGFSARSRYPEDHPQEDEAFRENQFFPSVGFSINEPNGEYGFTPLTDVIEITRDEFLNAQRRHWRESDDTTLDGSHRLAIFDQGERR